MSVDEPLIQVSKYICHLRRTVCPKTSYATAGDAASTLLVLTSVEFKSTFEKLQGFILAENEFDNVRVLERNEDILSLVNGHVVLVYGKVQDINDVRSVIATKTKLCCIVADPNTLNQSQGSLSDIAKVRIEIKLFDNSLGLLSLTRSTSSIPTVESLKENFIKRDFGGQSAVKSCRQFSYLWGIHYMYSSQDDLNAIQEAKLRVLQRLSEKELNDGEKFSTEEWDHIVGNILKTSTNKGADDWKIYNTIRFYTLGTQLEDDLNKESSIQRADGNGMHNAGGEGDGERAKFLVDTTIKNLPPSILKKQINYDVSNRPIKSLLDYGCAEGAITAELGKQLNVSSENMYGADVRSISCSGYNFLLLPAESKESGPSQPGSILPSLATNSIDFINLAMVLHHVIFPENVLLELRRVISSDGFLIIREHDCVNAATSAFLDIFHGLYSLSWSNPIEWPDFLAEYEAYYRSREVWDTMLKQCGFYRVDYDEFDGNAAVPQMKKSYDAATFSTWNKNKRRFVNLSRAYHGVYRPDPNFRFPVVTTSTNRINRKRSIDNSDDEENSDNSGAIRFPSKGPDGQDILYESRTYPGYFYRVDEATGETIWM